MIALFVKREHRKSGIGTSLVRRCVEEVRGMGIAALYLWTEEQGLTDYYTRRGWRIKGSDQSGNSIMRIVI